MCTDIIKKLQSYFSALQQPAHFKVSMYNTDIMMSVSNRRSSHYGQWTLM